MFIAHSLSLGLSAAIFIASELHAQRPVGPGVDRVSRDTFNAWMSRLSNRARWGSDDQLGTLNLVTSAKRVAAARSVRSGVVISLERDVIAGPDSNAIAPVRLGLAFAPGASPDSELFGAVDTLWVLAHGWSYTHMDALGHFAYRGSMYNGFAANQLKVEGAQRLGMENMRAGIVTRGVLVDIPRLKNVAYLPAGAAITAQDLEAWELANKVRIGTGDVLLIRTGRDARARLVAPFRVPAGTAGPHPSIAAWLKERGVAAIGSDVGNEVAPSLVDGVTDPLHLLVLVSLGMPILDNLDLEVLARESASRSRPTFMFIAAPLRLRGATGSLVNPLAIF